MEDLNKGLSSDNCYNLLFTYLMFIFVSDVLSLGTTDKLHSDIQIYSNRTD